MFSPDDLEIAVAEWFWAVIGTLKSKRLGDDDHGVAVTRSLYFLRDDLEIAVAEWFWAVIGKLSHSIIVDVCRMAEIESVGRR
ncbi:hypothetical protein ACLOJK_009895 [Asimina triloba]